MGLFKLFENIVKSINESTNTDGWVCVGEAPGYFPWSGEGDKTYIMVNPQKEMKGGRMVNNVLYTENPDGSGKQCDYIPSFYRNEIIIYPEHRSDEFGAMFLGKRLDNETIEKLHQKFISKLFVKGNKVIIHHNSSFRITDGMIRKGKANNWSNNTDVGIYFWGSRNSGNDPSNQSLYTYYCLINLKDLYDFSTNEEKLSLPQALRKYPYAGQFWKDGNAICVNTILQTPIWCILDKQTGTWYDKTWKEMEKPF